MTPEELRLKYSMYNNAWKFYKKWCITPHDWPRMIEEADVILNSYNNNSFIAGIMREIMQDLDNQDIGDELPEAWKGAKSGKS